MEDNTRSEGSLGAIIGMIIILAVIVLGGLYFWGQRSSMTPSDTSTGVNSTQSESDEIESIEADLNAMDIDAINTDL